MASRRSGSAFAAGQPGGISLPRRPENIFLLSLPPGRTLAGALSFRFSSGGRGRLASSGEDFRPRFSAGARAFAQERHCLFSPTGLAAAAGLAGLSLRCRRLILFFDSAGWAAGTSTTLQKRRFDAYQPMVVV